MTGADTQQGQGLGLAGGLVPQVAIVAGSGLSEELARLVQVHSRVSFADLFDGPAPSVPGHPGELLAGTLGGVAVWLFAGRRHTYEGFTAAQVAAPVRLAARAGAGVLVLTNAAGSLHPDWPVGDVMGVTDHINMLGVSPLSGPQFIGMGQAYSPRLLAAARDAAGEGWWREGVYAAMPGPAYETAAEVRMLSGFGADAVGMSTVLETLAGRAEGMEVFAASLLTNHATGVGTGAGHSHADVVAASQAAASRLAAVVAAVVAEAGTRR